jgi:hypothetical protein
VQFLQKTNKCTSTSWTTVSPKHFLKRALSVFILVGLTFCTLHTHLYAVEVQERETIPYDIGLSDQKNNKYGFYGNIAVTKLSAGENALYSDSQEWIKGFYYYAITKMGFTDLPYNYIVTWDGEVYEGKGGSAGVFVPINGEKSDVSTDSMVIAYFDNNREITNAGREALVDLFSRSMSKFDLEHSEITAVDRDVYRKDNKSVAQLVLSESVDENWVDIVDEIKSQVTISESSFTYKGNIESVDYPKEVKAGENFMVKVKVKNESNMLWYNSGEHRVMIGTSAPRNHESNYYVSDKWASFSRVVTTQKEWVLSGNVGTFEFEMNTPLIAGNYEETFEVLVLPDSWVKGTQFKVDFKVNAGGLDIVEIRDTETGSLNVRDCPSTGCDQIGQVVPGEKFVKLEQDGNWYKIKFQGDKQGWVYGKYVRDI